jgi:tetratricopeptide (TPR) repeat protein
MSYKKADRLVLERYEYGDPEGALELALEELAKVGQRRRDAEWHFLCGYCHFELEDADEAEPYFREALKLRPDHHWAGHYLGCVFFDQGEYDQALPLLQSSSEGLTQAFDDQGRLLKAQELLLCCQLYTQSKLPALRVMDDLIELFCSHLLIAPVPLDLARCLVDLTCQGRLKGQALVRWCHRLDDLVDGSGHSDSRKLRPYLKHLRDSARAFTARGRVESESE